MDRGVSISVVIPTHDVKKRGDSLKEAVGSVLSQSRLPDEIIVVNGGDDRLTLKGIAGSDLIMIRVVSSNRHGPSAARNRGILEAKGDYIAFLDDDDLWHPEKLEIQMDYLEKNPEIWMVSSTMVPMGGDIRIKGGRWISGDLFGVLYMKSIVPTPTVVVKREVFDRVGFFNEEMMRAEDYDLWLRITRFFPTAHLKSPLGWVGRGAGRLSDDKVDLRKNSIRLLEKYYDPKRISKGKYRKRMSELEIYLGREYMKIGDLKEGRSHFVKAVRFRPLSLRPYRYLLGSVLR
ncbi:MAG: glycosyltransferase family 2 protein [Deltaproteobacteria bacterium]|uniref:Glycosyltransferase family 2 protein n=1 Tax=Candidatus Zymogenus saltonus TaxID=2844893 RepID=A0A9D8KCU0_9DELT|nr:glycosyltransferase family 2 protein [Candidatus Zymogenus saltonus]